ncbi:MAG: hypothetical protein ACXWWC_02315 [Chitinophagaceae bacterium]
MKFVSMNSSGLTTIALFLAILVFSCKKENANSNDKAVTEAEAEEYSAESMETEASYDDIQDISMSAADEEGIISAGRGQDFIPFPFLKLRLRIGAKATITVTPSDNTYPKTVTIDFVNGGDNCPDGRFRKGKIVMDLTGPIRTPGSVITIKLVDFQVGRLKVEGTKTITNLSANGIIKFSVVVTGGKVTYPNGRTYTYEKIKTVTQTGGSATTDITDDVYSIEGSSTTTFKNGAVIAINTVSPLIKKVSCAWVSEGTLKMQIKNHEFLLDYAFPNNGDCDNKALLKYNSKEKIIELP